MATSQLNEAAVPAFDAACNALAAQLVTADAPARDAMLGPKAAVKWHDVAAAVRRAARAAGLEQDFAPGLEQVRTLEVCCCMPSRFQLQGMPLQP